MEQSRCYIRCSSCYRFRTFRNGKEYGSICILDNYIDLLNRLILIPSTINRKHQVRCLSLNVEAVSL